MLPCLVPVLFTFYVQDVLKFKCKIPARKGSLKIINYNSGRMKHNLSDPLASCRHRYNLRVPHFPILQFHIECFFSPRQFTIQISHPISLFVFFFLEANLHSTVSQSTLCHSSARLLGNAEASGQLGRGFATLWNSKFRFTK